jgi:hypothetical protein
MWAPPSSSRSGVPSSTSFRRGAKQVDCIPSPPTKAITTSTLLCLLAAVFKHKFLVWDEIEKYPDAARVMELFDKAARTGFSWDSIKLDPTDPEKWEYAG